MRNFAGLLKPVVLYNREFKIQRRGRQLERQKTIGLISKTTTSHVQHTFLFISFPFLPNFAFYGGRKQATTKFYFSFWAWIWPLEIQLQEGSPTIDKVSRGRNNRYRDWKNSNLLKVPNKASRMPSVIFFFE